MGFCPRDLETVLLVGVGHLVPCGPGDLEGLFPDRNRILWEGEKPFFSCRWEPAVS